MLHDAGMVLPVISFTSASHLHADTSQQVVEVLHDVDMKQKWLLDRLQRFIDDGDVLVFANQKASWFDSASLAALGVLPSWGAGWKLHNLCSYASCCVHWIAVCYAIRLHRPRLLLGCSVLPAGKGG